MSKKSILKKILAIVAQKTIARYKPRIVGITGSVGKTSAKEAIALVLKKKHQVRSAEKNYNNEIGMPLAILGIPHYGKNIFRWIWALSRAYVRLFIPLRMNYPEILVLEYGIDKPGDMDYLLSIARPDVAVITAIGEIPVHVEFFKDLEELIQEKAKLVLSVGENGHIILNHDEYAVLSMTERVKGTVFTYGFEEHAMFRVTHYDFRIHTDSQRGAIPDGMNLKIAYRGLTVPFRLHGTFGKAQAYAVLAASATGAAFGMNLVEISEAMEEYYPPPGRMRLLEGIKESFILDDTYNASPESMRAALDSLRSLPARRKIAVLGDMLELGHFSEQAHRAIGDMAAEFLDFLFVVGPRAKFIADEAATRGIQKNARIMSRERMFEFDDSISAGKALDQILRQGDLVLVKGSQAIRMERAVEEIMAHPERAAELLVRQDTYWKNK